MTANGTRLFEQVAVLLPREFQQALRALPEQTREQVEEIRLRNGHPVSLNLNGREIPVSGSGQVTENDLRAVLELASRSSVHAVMDRLCSGFLTVRGGHRIGICGTVSIQNGTVGTMRHITSMNIRVAREVKGCADGILPALFEKEKLHSTLILAPPGEGKTTLLRDVIRSISEGSAAQLPLRVGVADERGELAACFQGEAQLDLGSHTDILDGGPKAEGLIRLLRGMNPQVLAMDEITAENDLEALCQAAGCGVSLLATAHGTTPEQLGRRPLYRTLLQEHIFQRFVSIERIGDGRAYRVWREEDLPC